MNCLRLLVLLATAALTGCGGGRPMGSQAQADAATQTACRQRADEIYNQQNRGQIYSPASQVNTPFSNNYIPDQPDRGLSQLFAHDKLVSNCVRNVGTGAERSAPASAAPAVKP